MYVKLEQIECHWDQMKKKVPSSWDCLENMMEILMLKKSLKVLEYDSPSSGALDKGPESNKEGESVALIIGVK